MFKRTLFIIILFQYGSIYASRPEIKFRHLKVKDGLSQSWVRSICQDRQGFMWFGTDDGLNKYDGYTMTTYYHNPKNKNSLNGSTITAIYEDTDSNLWIGTEGGLNRYDRTNDKFIRHNQWQQGPITDFLELTDGKIIFSTRNNGLHVFDPKTNSAKILTHDNNDTSSISNNSVNAILKDRNGNIWIGTSDGLNLLDVKNYKFIRIKKDDKDENSLSDNYIT